MNPLAYAKKFTDTAVTGLFDQLRRNREIALNAAEHPRCLMSDSKVEGNKLKCVPCGETAEWRSPWIGSQHRDDNGKCKGNLFWKDGSCQACSGEWKDHVCSRCGTNPRTDTSWCDDCKD